MKTSIIILHGWGLSGSKYEGLVKILEKKGFKVFAPDMPGFGQEALQSKSMNLGDYADFIKEFIEKNKILNPIMIGHSFGGRVGIKLVSKYEDKISKLVLTGVPIIRHKTFKRQIGAIVAYGGHLFFDKAPDNFQNILRKILYRSIGEWDYYKSGELKTVFKNIIQEDLVSVSKRIKIPVMLVWGAEDKFVPSSDVDKIKKIIPECESAIVDNTGHKLPYEKPELFFNALRSFIS